MTPQTNTHAIANPTTSPKQQDPNTQKASTPKARAMRKATHPTKNKTGSIQNAAPLQNQEADRLKMQPSWTGTARPRQACGTTDTPEPHTPSYARLKPGHLQDTTSTTDPQVHDLAPAIATFDEDAAWQIQKETMSSHIPPMQTTRYEDCLKTGKPPVHLKKPEIVVL